MAVVIPKRTRNLGVFAADPTATEQGQWYWNSVSLKFRVWTGTEWLDFSKEWATGTATLIVAVGGDYFMNVTVTGLTSIGHIVNVNIDTDPIVDPGSVTNKVITGNVVGFTLVGVGGGTTLTAEVVAVN